MILCDCGNTNIKFYDFNILRTEEVSEKLNFPDEKFFYVNVNSSLDSIFEKNLNAINLSPYINIKTKYKGLGIDRQVLCNYLEDGIIVDAGSAITIDLMDKGEHKGGYILPGLTAYQKSFLTVSNKLQTKLKPTNIDIIPQNTDEALSCGVIKSIVLLIKSLGKKKIYLTGGDANILKEYFEDILVDKYLIFKAMREIIKEKYLGL
ncbi:MAG: Pantothenate kinase type III, CoaX-like (EC [uncultured Campylobacterales bacterium]|uniref:Type III pantothenate kinase n=1 Tax=uncultured Campylobacterales bacterium TaxID=352960 RepID=A0A6S6SCJ9_9BACT|nr:MAG: Pantothenate kinase type III, CoaX-like (EC [uncultured Campylobacterales bacterium]